MPSTSAAEPPSTDGPQATDANAGPAPPTAKMSYWQALTTLSPSREMERLSTGHLPCARNSALLGIATGAALAGVGVVARRPLRSSLNWAVGAFVFVSLAAFQTCRSSRAAEKQRVQVFVDEYRKKRPNGPQIFVGDVDA